ncbi:iron-sulfur cluster assembly accessory protein [Leptolyngbya sp. CCNP1308]|uniref:HesB/IscA family protein n=1 Tax=Leptolyngbya sp. CCNP1308 TaxID=3110255 RepID=UPI002B2170A8|nr:iron-sulfur cluster assembly accessory protein [Leptolyngbya sp. CCNP1308]MEA5452224.1 iron-sulfur cluster assembly accessory protein [Leptolyngbya sp. CCNP1308]
MVQIRPAAAQELKRLLRRHNAQSPGHSPQIYLALEPGGCADWTYRLTAEATPQESLDTLACGDISLAVPSGQMDLVKDLTIDYAEDLMGGGFRFVNPLAQRTCGCGNAFAITVDAPVTQDCTAAHLPTP